VLPDEMKQEVQRALEILEPDRVRLEDGLKVVVHGIAKNAKIAKIAKSQNRQRVKSSTINLAVLAISAILAIVCVST
jgi:hypothetical protein